MKSIENSQCKKEIHMKTLYIDHREIPTRKEVFTRFFEKKGFEVIEKQLEFGDYACGDCAIEFKTHTDFIDSVYNTSVFNQIHELREKVKFPALLIEGSIRKARKMRQMAIVSDKCLRKSYINLHSKVPVFNSKNMNESCHYMLDFFKYCENDIHFGEYHTYHKLTNEPVVNYLGGIKGVNSKYNILSAKIASKLKLQTLDDLMKITREDLLTVPGVGVRVANKIMKWL